MNVRAHVWDRHSLIRCFSSWRARLGDSSRPVGGNDKKTLANDIWRLAYTTLGASQLLVAAHDWGGPVAFALAAQHREAVRGLAI